MIADPAQLPDDVDALKRMIVALTQDAVHARTLIEKLRFELARLKRQQFGASSEKLDGRVEQLELAIEALETDRAERSPDGGAPASEPLMETAGPKPARRALPDHLPREEVIHPGPCACPSCGAVVQAPAPFHAIARGRRPGLLAHIMVAKFDDHLPLYRQAEIYAREGVALETSTLSGWVGATAAALMPLVELLRRDVIAGSAVLHGDDTPVPILAPGTGKTRTGRLWTYVRHERPHGGARPPAAVFFARRTGRVSARLATWPGSPAFCRRTAMPASMACTRAGASSRRDAGRSLQEAPRGEAVWSCRRRVTSVASSSTSISPPARPWPARRWSGSARSTTSSATSEVAPLV